MVKKKVLLSELNEGALQEQFDFELEQVTKTSWTQIQTQIRSERSQLILLFYLMNIVKIWCLIVKIKSKLAPRENVSSRVLIGKNAKGEVVTNELKSGQRGQMYFDPEDSELKDDKGTPVTQD